jgi:hypothetical protein
MQDVLQALGILLGSAMLVLVHEGRRVLLEWMARQRLEGALGRAAGMVLQDSAVQAAGQVALGAAVGVGVDYVQRAIPDTLQKLGVDTARLNDMIVGQVGQLMGRRS